MRRACAAAPSSANGASRYSFTPSSNVSRPPAAARSSKLRSCTSHLGAAQHAREQTDGIHLCDEARQARARGEIQMKIERVGVVPLVKTFRTPADLLRARDYLAKMAFTPRLSLRKRGDRGFERFGVQLVRIAAHDPHRKNHVGLRPFVPKVCKIVAARRIEALPRIDRLIADHQRRLMHLRGIHRI